MGSDRRGGRQRETWGEMRIGEGERGRGQENRDREKPAEVEGNGTRTAERAREAGRVANLWR